MKINIILIPKQQHQPLLRFTKMIQLTLFGYFNKTNKILFFILTGAIFDSFLQELPLSRLNFGATNFQFLNFNPYSKMLQVILLLIAIPSISCLLVPNSLVVRQYHSMFKSVNFCGIPFNSDAFNDCIDRDCYYEDSFFETIGNIKFHDSINSGVFDEGIERRFLLLAALLNDANSTLCQSILANPYSYFVAVSATLYKSLSISTDTSVTLKHHASVIFQGWFFGRIMIDEVKEEFNSNIYLKNIQFPTYQHQIASSDLLLLRTIGDSTCSSFAIASKMKERMPEYISFMSSFYTIVAPKDAFVFDELFQILSIKNIVYNKLIHLLLFQQNNPLSKWVLDNYQRVIELRGDEFINAYLDFIFNPDIYKYIFKTIKGFNCKSKLYPLRGWNYEEDHLNEFIVKAFMFTNYFQGHIFSLNGRIVPLMAHISFFSMDIIQIERTLSIAFKVALNDGKKLCCLFENLCTFLMSNEYYLHVTGELPKRFEQIYELVLSQLHHSNIKQLQFTLMEFLFKTECENLSTNFPHFCRLEKEFPQFKKDMKEIIGDLGKYLKMIAE